MSLKFGMEVDLDLPELGLTSIFTSAFVSTLTPDLGGWIFKTALTQPIFEVGAWNCNSAT